MSRRLELELESVLMHTTFAEVQYKFRTECERLYIPRSLYQLLPNDALYGVIGCTFFGLYFQIKKEI